MHSQISHFGDLRLDRVHGDMHDRLVKNGPQVIPVRNLGCNRAGEVCYSRLLHKPKVAEQKIVEQAALGKAKRSRAGTFWLARKRLPSSNQLNAGLDRQFNSVNR